MRCCRRPEACRWITGITTAGRSAPISVSAKPEKLSAPRVRRRRPYASAADLFPGAFALGVAHLGLFALRPAHSLHIRRDHRSDRWLRRLADCRPANHRLVDAVIAYRLHLSVDALA